MKFFYYIHKARKLPFQIALLKAINLLWRNIKVRKFFFKDQLFSTYIKKDNKININKFNFSAIELNELKNHKKMILDISDYYYKHYFDLLGSGWTKVFYGIKVRGLEGYCYTDSKLSHKKNLKNRITRNNLKQAQKIASLIDVNYEPIDWQLDFKSGYRWSEKNWYMNIKYGHKPGVDIKIPWELSRMQHLVMLAYAYMITNVGDRNKYLCEYRNQILDFIANNPPRFGVNWRCTMDVGIRVANWLIAYDLFKAAGVEFDNEFEDIIASSVYDHGFHIINNLEYTPSLRSNHYLSDIAGLLFVSVYLKSTKEIDSWLAFSVQELISEMKHEFHPDGSNFEASTSYHRLSTEIMLYCSILCLSLPEEKKKALVSYSNIGHWIKPKLNLVSEQLYDISNKQLFPDWFWVRLEKACEFTLHITKPHGAIPQFGDNDSGRFLKLWPSYTKMTVGQAVDKYENLKGYQDLSVDATYYDENILDHQHILAVGGILFNRQDFLQKVDSNNLEKYVVNKILNGIRIPSYHIRGNLIQSDAFNRFILSNKNFEQWETYLQKNYGQPVVSIFSSLNNNDLIDGLQVFSYPDFGLYLYKSKDLYLAIRCGNVGQNGNGGHGHNDQLSIELCIDDQEVVRDPGTYIYTPLPDSRNKFRSTEVHFTPQVQGKEQSTWFSGQVGLFGLDRVVQSEVLLFDSKGFIGRHSGFGTNVYRMVQLASSAIIISDYSMDHLNNGFFEKYSNGYGKLVSCKN
ncbi:heparinase II/III family protein [Propionispora vibrioides]|uniref:Heparinase II/III-like protein n=1 Tax=Propionispora vibrioides TaxID=112903 RepID=A0A1H8RZZ7_9FIRM|nr:heparinase II/III family protein [Propionispora vibrioides]SEO72259.1 Heparinase II/III-like protein [Propionispora vibrioides]